MRSCFTTSVTQSLPKLSHAKTSAPRAPSSDQSAASTAPVSEPTRIPRRKPSGMPSTAFERSITSASFALPGFERCERPSTASLSASVLQPGRFAHGPEEKKGRSGRRVGRVMGRAA